MIAERDDRGRNENYFEDITENEQIIPNKALVDLNSQVFQFSISVKRFPLSIFTTRKFKRAINYSWLEF